LFFKNLNTSSLFTNTQTTAANNSLTEVTNSNYSLNTDLSSVLQSISQPPPPPIDNPTESSSFQYQGGHLPLLPPPMPPFSAKSDYESSYQTYASTDKTNYGKLYSAVNNFCLKNYIT
jgi:hypothetical protein